jgi:hypothetical protein
LIFDDILAGTAIGLFSYSSNDTTPTPTQTPTLTPDIPASPTPRTTPTLTPTTTPKEECQADSMQVSSDKTSLFVGEVKDVYVKITGNDNCLVEGASIKAKVTKGKRLLNLSSRKETTDANGEAVFAITANKSGKAKVMFKSNNLKKKISVTIKED